MFASVTASWSCSISNIETDDESGLLCWDETTGTKMYRRTVSGSGSGTGLLGFSLDSDGTMKVVVPTPTQDLPMPQTLAKDAFTTVETAVYSPELCGPGDVSFTTSTTSDLGGSGGFYAPVDVSATSIHGSSQYSNASSDSTQDGSAVLDLQRAAP